MVGNKDVTTLAEYFRSFKIFFISKCAQIYPRHKHQNIAKFLISALRDSFLELVYGTILLARKGAAEIIYKIFVYAVSGRA